MGRLGYKENDFEFKQARKKARREQCSNGVITYLIAKFSSFLDLIKKAEAIQELKLQKYGAGDRLNATEMARPFGKNAGHWLRNQQTKDFISELSALRNRKGSDLVVIENGVGSWMHEDVALEFSRWLSPAFAIWCNDRIKEVLNHEINTMQCHGLLFLVIIFNK